MKLTNNFRLQEFIHPDIYDKIGDRSLDFLNPLLAMTVQQLRDEFGPITINDWVWGGNFEDSGLRLPHGSVGAMMSAHKFGAAVDLKFKNVKPLEVQTEIMKRPEDYPYISRMENAEITKYWLHIECGKRYNGIYVFNP